MAGLPVAVGTDGPPKVTMLYMTPAAASAFLQTLWTDGRSALLQELQILQLCKHVDRKRNRMPCPCHLRTRNHKRGYLAIVCESGHQWVWCSYCCDCTRPQVGCCNPNHWMERDSFDTGRRNHMQRHLENYDANNDKDGQLMAMMAPRQVVMPWLVVESGHGDQSEQHSSQGEWGAGEEEDEKGYEDDYESQGGKEEEVEEEGGTEDESGNRSERDGSERGLKRRRDQHPLFNDELAELAASALLALARTQAPQDHN